ncbi:regulatory protein RecX [Aquimarina hainanensis]|uniref:Regulatory protein RecX n=1 Tax=Aquimarina hainanensis TaxID=1578017 RepID=A0ABW5N2T6_9FLAO|nr:regulatory protein RecX [Aquimarina sp. TRL1]QKX04501.1 RecX family transcriptional regulator [Aquimarina sp. TRL1]
MYKRPQQVVTVAEAIKKLEHYCAYQERCHQEVEKKIATYSLIPEAKEKIILHLLAHNYLNEERFAKSFARGKFSIKKWGKNRITQELKIRHISTRNITTALSDIENSEYLKTLNELAIKKLDTIKETDKFKKRKKLADYLLYRGWESHLVYEKTTTLIP